MIYCKWNITLLKQPTWTGRRWTSWQNLGSGQGRTWTWGLWITSPAFYLLSHPEWHIELWHEVQKNFEISWVWLVSHVTLWIILQCIFKKFATFYKKRPGFLFHPLYPQLLDPNFVVAPYLGLDTQNWFSSF